MEITLIYESAKYFIGTTFYMGVRAYEIENFKEGSNLVVCKRAGPGGPGKTRGGRQVQRARVHGYNGSGITGFFLKKNPALSVSNSCLSRVRRQGGPDRGAGRIG